MHALFMICTFVFNNLLFVFWLFIVHRKEELIPTQTVLATSFLDKQANN
jgi:hypothetical protein